MKKLIIILVATLLSFSALNAEQYHLKTSSGQSWKSVYSEKYEQHVAEINIEHHKLTILRLENKFRLLFQPIFYYDREILKYGKVTNYYYKHQYGVNVDGSAFSAWKKCAGLSEDTMPCHKTGEYYMIDLEEKHIDVLKKGNEIWYDTSTFTDDLTFTFSLKGFTEAFNESFAKSMKQAEKSLKQAEEELDRLQEVMRASRQEVNKLVEEVNVQLPADIVGGGFTLERFTLKEDMSLRAEITPKQPTADLLLLVPGSAHILLKKDFCRIDLSKLFIDEDEFEYIFTWKDKIIKKKITVSECNEK